MPRPSRNIDQTLISAALELLPVAGTRVLSIRQVCEHAGVNLGMFHYHFKTRDMFLRAVLQQTYDGMFATLELEAAKQTAPKDGLRAAVMTLARFARIHRHLLVRLVGDALAGETVAVEFLKNNLPRHVGLVTKLIAAAQRDGTLRRIPPLQALTFLIGGTGAPILLGTAIAASGMLPARIADQFEKDTQTDEAVALRIDMALAGLAPPTAARTTKPGVRT